MPTNEAELVAHSALVSVLKQLESQKAKGQQLTAAFRRTPGLARYWRTAFDYRRSCDCGVSLKTLNHALTLAELEPVPVPEATGPVAADLRIEISGVTDITATADIIVGGAKAGTFVFIVGPAMRNALAALAAAGVRVVVPKWAERVR